MRLPLDKILPPPHRAFPMGRHDTLLKAAIHTDEQRALAFAEAWLRENSIEKASFREQRLLVAIGARFKDRLTEQPAHARLVSLRRTLWMRSLFSLREASSTLAALAGSLELMLFKGAARLTEGNARQGERVAHDIDVIVRPQQMRLAFEILTEQGWRPADGFSPAYARQHLAQTRSLNMFRGSHGDIDLHAQAFHPGQGSAQDEAALWARSISTRLDGIAVRLPSPEDALALALAHGGLDAHAHSDWLVDAARLIGHGALDWDRFHAIAEARGIQAPALIALSYLSGEAGAAIPARIIAKLSDAAGAEPLRYMSGFLQARPRDRAAAVGNALRGTVKALRKRAEDRQLGRVADCCLRVRRVWRRAVDGDPSPALEHLIQLAPGPRRGRAYFRAVLQISAPPVARRIEIELNGASTHICRIRYRKWDRTRLVTLSVSGCIDVPHQEVALSLVAHPSRLLRPESGQAERDKYAALPFRSLHTEIADSVS